jgi:IclR family acetate operon transcriptional repressor
VEIQTPGGEAEAGGAGSARYGTAEKVVRLLELLAASRDGVGVREVSRETGMDKSAVSRLLDRLAQLTVAQQAPASGRYYAGPRLFALGATVHARDTLWQAAEPILRSLVARFNETCYLAIREGRDVVFREKVDCDHYLRYVIDAGERMPLHAGAGGRAVLAGVPPAEFERILAAMALPQLTPNTITDPAELRRQASEDRRRGYSVSMGERVPEGSAVAAPFLLPDGSCGGAVVLTCPAIRFDVRRVPEIADAVVAAGRSLSSRIGYKPDALPADAGGAPPGQARAAAVT